MTVKSKPPAPPPVWQGRPGTMRPLLTMHAVSAYSAAVRLGLSLPGELVAAVARASYANTLSLDVHHAVTAARDAYAAAARAHIRGEGPMPTLDDMARASAAEATVSTARGLLGGAQDEAEAAAVAQVRAASDDLIRQAAPILERVLDDLAEPVAAIPPTAKTIEDVARSPRPVLDAWRVVEDALPRFDDCRELRTRLGRLAGLPDQVIEDGILAYWDPTAATRALGGLHDPAAILVGSVRGRAAMRPWCPTDAELTARIAERKQSAAGKLPRGLRGAQVVA